MQADNRARRVMQTQSSREMLAIDPIADLLDMALGLDIYRSVPIKASRFSTLGIVRKQPSQQAQLRTRTRASSAKSS